MTYLNRRNRTESLRELGASRRTSGFNVKRIAFWAFGVIAVLIVLSFLLPACLGYYDERETTTRVITKERVCDSDGDGGIECKYMIFTEDGTFEITDSLLGNVRFNSADVYGRIEEGKTYKIIYFGWRLPWASQFPNVEEITEVTP